MDILDAADFLATSLFDTGAYHAAPGTAVGMADLFSQAEIAVLAGAVSSGGKPPARKPAGAVTRL